MQTDIQDYWREEKLFEQNICADTDDGKFFATFCYPYMNGFLHLGHAFTMIRADFACAYQRLQGKTVLFPFGFHGSGMPISSSADRVSRGDREQIDILLKMGIPSEDIHHFRDPYHWLRYFSERAKNDVSRLGCGVDWRRSFITTDMDRYYDSFVKWQFRHLYQSGRLHKDKKYIIYSPVDKQPCSDHERRIGEGVKPKRVCMPVLVYALEDGKQVVVAHDIIGVCDGYFAVEPNKTIVVTPDIARNLYHQHMISSLVPVSCPSVVSDLDGISSTLTYYIPDGPVVSRSGDQCVVALIDQWVIDYGEPDWMDKTKTALANMDITDEVVRNGLNDSIETLSSWGCTRTRGLGTRFPPEPAFVIDSLSDSTIYMALYTVGHLMKQYPVDEFTDDVWDYIFDKGPLPSSSIPTCALTEMHREFFYWYPVDVRVSGKDLISNHLTFCVYNHTAMWSSSKMYPRSFQCNGHLTLNNEKMSKSTGNFLTLHQALEEYGADAVRIALAESGDGMDDGNFETSTANSAILRLTKELEWIEAILSDESLRDGAKTLFDKVIDQDVDICSRNASEAYERFEFRRALKHSWYDMLKARDRYRQACAYSSMHRDCIDKFVKCLCVMFAPIAPHFCEHVWRRLLKHDTSVLMAAYPTSDPIDDELNEMMEYIDSLIHSSRKKMSKRKSGNDALYITVSDGYARWQRITLEHTGTDEELIERVLDYFPGATTRTIMATVLPFRRCRKYKTEFDEREVIESNIEYIQHVLGVSVTVMTSDKITKYAPAQITQ